MAQEKIKRERKEALRGIARAHLASYLKKSYGYLENNPSGLTEDYMFDLVMDVLRGVCAEKYEAHEGLSS
jgi:hypothetical protein